MKYTEETAGEASGPGSAGGPEPDHKQPEQKKLHPQKEARAAGSSLRNPRRAMEALARFSLGEEPVSMV